MFTIGRTVRTKIQTTQLRMEDKDDDENRKASCLLILHGDDGSLGIFHSQLLTFLIHAAFGQLGEMSRSGMECRAMKRSNKAA